MSIRVVIIEDDSRYRGSLEALFQEEPGFVLAASFESALPMLAAAESQNGSGDGAIWDLALMDLQLPEMSGIEATWRLKRTLPELPVVVLTVFEEPETILRAIRAGADGYLLKKTSAPELLAQLRSIVSGGSPLTPAVAHSVLALIRHAGAAGPTPRSAEPQPTRLDLSEREQQVLRLLARGMSYKQVADEAGLSIDTVRTHIRHVYRKLHVHSVTEAIGRAIREGLV